MKKILALTFLFISLKFIAQEPPEMAKYNAKNAANIFYYNLNEVPKEIKVKEEGLISKLNKALRKYNDKIKNLSFLNSAKLAEIEFLINTNGKQIFTNRSLAEKIKKQIEQTIIPIRDTIEKEEKMLNTTLEKELSKRQYKKWIKYQKKEKRKLLPEPPKSNNNSNPPNNNMGRSFNGGRRF